MSAADGKAEANYDSDNDFEKPKDGINILLIKIQTSCFTGVHSGLKRKRCMVTRDSKRSQLSIGNY